MDIDTTPEANPMHFTMAGDVGVIDIVTAAGIPLIPPTVIMQLTGASGGVHNLNETLSREGWQVFPPLRLTLSGSLADPSGAILSAEDVGVTFGLMSTEIHTGPVSLANFFTLLDEAYYRVEMLDNGKTVAFTVGGKPYYLPDITYSVAGGGSTSLLNLIHGQLSMQFSAQLSKLASVTLDGGTNLAETLMQGDGDLKGSAQKVLVGYAHAISLSGSGDIAGIIPNGVPIFGGLRFASASASFDKYRLAADIQIGPVGAGFTIDWDIPGNIDRVLSMGRSMSMTAFGVDTAPGFSTYGVADDGTPYKVTVGTNLTPLAVAQDDAGPMLFALSGSYSASNSFTVTDASQPVLVIVRSETQPSLTLTEPNGGTAPLTLASWSQSDGEDYYVNYVVVDSPEVGEYTLTAMGGTIDIDPLSVGALPSVSGVNVSGTTVSWTAADLDGGKDYRIGIELMRESDTHEYITVLVTIQTMITTL